MLVNVEKLRAVATIDIGCEPMDYGPEGHFSYETKEENDKAVASVHALLKQTPWGWCTARVTAFYADVAGSTFLNSCSYESKEDFIESNDYCAAMVTEALEALADRLNRIVMMIERDNLRDGGP